MIALGDNRVYRFYEGGLLLDRFVGRADPRDGDHPEDWVGSTTRAKNPGRDPDEGRDARVAGALGELPLLVKLLDTSVRLPIHCHPTRAFARAKFGSFFGKTEAWIVVETRTDDAYVMLGFREGTKKADFRRHLERQDVDDMKACLHRVPVRAGDVWFVQAGLPHAIGEGVFLVELQEPTDFSIVAEWSGFPIAPGDAHLGLGWDDAFEAFDFTGWSEDALARRFRHAPRLVRDERGGAEHALFGPEAEPFFGASRLAVRGEMRVAPSRYVGIVMRGRGAIEGSFGERALGRGDRFVVDAADGEHAFRGDGLEVLRCVPPRTSPRQ